MMNELEKLVLTTYFRLYGKTEYSREIVSDNNITLTFPLEKIQLDNFVARRFRLTFTNYDGVVDRFREEFDKAYGFVYYNCDVSNFIDLTETFIKQINNYFK